MFSKIKSKLNKILFSRASILVEGPSGRTTFSCARLLFVKLPRDNHPWLENVSIKLFVESMLNFVCLCIINAYHIREKSVFHVHTDPSVWRLTLVINPRCLIPRDIIVNEIVKAINVLFVGRDMCEK